jgi:hypothetical protein
MPILIAERIVKWGGLVFAPVLFILAFRSTDLWISLLLSLGGAFFLFITLIFIYQMIRPNRSRVEEKLKVESWTIVSDGTHNSNTDMIYWNGAFYLVHASSPYHLASKKCRLILRRSVDAGEWELVASLGSHAKDIRDPKFAIIGGRLFLYALLNRTVNPEPYTTVYSYSSDGHVWEEFRETEHQGWLFWRPKTRDGRTWYVPAYWWEHGKSSLFRSTDGIHWDYVSEIYRGGRNDETAIEFAADGSMIMTARLEFSEMIHGDPRACTRISISKEPYDTWSGGIHSFVTRLDGPVLFTYRNRVYAVGRYQPKIDRFLRRQGSIFTIKRTALFVVDPDKGLRYLSDLPSTGDTSYAGIVLRDRTLYTCYYTNRVDRDYIWIEGMLAPSEIRMAKIDLGCIAELAAETVDRV